MTTPAPAAGPDYPTPTPGPPAPHQGDDLAFARDTADARGDGCLALAAQLEESEEVRQELARRCVALLDQVARVEALHKRSTNLVWSGPHCSEDGEDWPCPTRLALHPSSPTLDSARAGGDQQEDAVAEGDPMWTGVVVADGKLYGSLEFVHEEARPRALPFAPHPGEGGA